MEVKRVLEIDNLSRNPDAIRTLYTHNDLDTNKSWDFSLPTLVSDKNPFNSGDLKTTYHDKIMEKLFGIYPELKNINMNNILIAGGCVGKLILSQSIHNQDIDIFIYGLDKESAEKKIMEIYNTIRGNFVKMNIDKKVFYTYVPYLRTSKYTLINDKFQIIHRLYKDKAEILHGFDIGSSSVGIDNNYIYFTELSKFSYEHKCNIVDTTRRSTSYEHRLQKYFKRGFNIILPYFDITKISDEIYNSHDLPPAVIMPYLVFTHYNIYKNKIVVSNFYNRKNANISDYDDEKAKSGTEEYKYFHLNIKRILNGENNLVLFSQDLVNDKISHQLKSSRIDYLYETLFEEIHKNVKFPTQKCINYLCKDVLKVFTIKDDKSALLELVEEIKEKIRNFLKNNIDEIPWIIDNPTSQLTSSFNPIVEEPEKWYGEYYINSAYLEEHNSYAMH